MSHHRSTQIKNIAHVATTVTNRPIGTKYKEA